MADHITITTSVARFLIEKAGHSSSDSRILAAPTVCRPYYVSPPSPSHYCKNILKLEKSSKMEKVVYK